MTSKAQPVTAAAAMPTKAAPVQGKLGSKSVTTVKSHGDSKAEKMVIGLLVAAAAGIALDYYLTISTNLMARASAAETAKEMLEITKAQSSSGALDFVTNHPVVTGVSVVAMPVIAAVASSFKNALGFVQAAGRAQAFRAGGLDAL